MLVELPTAALARLEGACQQTGKDFPIVLAVLRGIQRGRAFVDDIARPERAVVIHKYGFAGVLGPASDRFDDEILALFSRPGIVHRDYALLYWPHESLARALAAAKPGSFKIRRRVRLQRPPHDGANRDPDAAVVALRGAVLETARPLGADLESRMWDSAEHFESAGMGVALIADGAPASICYAAALVDGKAEVDIVTAEAHRGQGLGQRALAAFLALADAQKVTALWDCFETNMPSLRLALRNGFIETARYDFLTFQTPVRRG
jgi:RimJ/RimL family protein N-acetyltransferase